MTNHLQAHDSATIRLCSEYESIIRMRPVRPGKIEYQCAIQHEGSDVSVSEWTDRNGAHLASLAMLAELNAKLFDEALAELDEQNPPERFAERSDTWVDDVERRAAV